MRVRCAWIKTDSEGRIIIPNSGYERAPEKVAQINAIRHDGTHGAYMNLIADETDLILVARLPSEEELTAAAERGVALDVQAVALDAFVFVVNTGNAVDNLTLDDVRAIYTGKVTDWAELGGAPGAISAFQRNPNSGSQELMESLVMLGLPMVEADGVFSNMIITMDGLMNQVAYRPHGIGYSVYYYVVNILPDERVKLLSINGVAPTAKTITNRSYPLTTKVYAVVREDMPADAPAIVLRNWLLTPAGQRAVAASGYAPLR